jgi:hypothetical protein
MKNKKEEDWIQKKWRPMMAMMYMVVCVFDFIIFPIMFTVVQFWEIESANDAFRQWQPLTLIGAGLFHMAMGAVLGISAWSRGQEKIAGAATNTNNSATPNIPQLTDSYSTPAETIRHPANRNSFVAPTVTQPVTQYHQESSRTFVSKSGKPGPVIEEPEL